MADNSNDIIEFGQGQSVPDKEKRVTSVMGPGLFQELEQWRTQRGISRSQAIRELVQEGIEDETWLSKVADAQEALEGNDVVAIAATAVKSNGDGPVKLHAREGLDADFPLPMSDQPQALSLALIFMLDAYADLVDEDVPTVAEALVRTLGMMKDQDALQDFDLGEGA